MPEYITHFLIPVYDTAYIFSMNERTRKVEALIRRVRDLSTLPTAVKRLVELTQDPNVSISSVEEAVSTDPVISTRLLRIVNSAYYSFFREIKSIRQAVMVLGLETTKNLIYGTSIITAFGRVGKIERFPLAQFWQYSVACGYVSRTLASLLNYEGFQEAFLAGLIHDVGKIALATVTPDTFEKAIDLSHENSTPLTEAEETVFGFNHSDVGQHLAHRWHLPAMVEEVITYNEHPRESKDHPELVSIVRLASLLCRARKVGVSGEPDLEIDLENDAAWQVLKEKNPYFDTLDFDQFNASLDDEIEKVDAFVKALFEE